MLTKKEHEKLSKDIRLKVFESAEAEVWTTAFMNGIRLVMDEIEKNYITKSKK